METFTTKSDPVEREVEATGAMRDTQEGKPRYDLIGLHMLKRLAYLLERGARKYSERNWEKGQRVSRTLGSLWRHLIDYQMGDRTEDHLAAIVFNSMSIQNVEGEVEAGRLSADLLDLPFYRNVPAFKAAFEKLDAGKPLSEFAQTVYDFMLLMQRGHQWAYWHTGNELRKSVFPTMTAVHFSKIMLELHERGLVFIDVVEDQVYPDYALWENVKCDREKDPDDYEPYAEEDASEDAHNEDMGEPTYSAQDVQALSNFPITPETQHPIGRFTYEVKAVGDLTEEDFEQMRRNMRSERKR